MLWLSTIGEVLYQNVLPSKELSLEKIESRRQCAISIDNNYETCQKGRRKMRNGDQIHKLTSIFL